MRFALLFFLVLTVAGRAASNDAVMLQGVAQGTTWHVKFVAPSANFDSEGLKGDIESKLAEIDRQMSTYRNDSEVSRFNRAPAGEWFGVSPAVVEVVEKSHEISEKSGGAQDITVGPLVNLWRFGPKDSASSAKKAAFKPPTDEVIQATRKRVGYKKLDARITPPALRKQVDGLEIDLSSIASGYTIDQLAAIMRDHGIKNYMVELGGELCASGARPDGSPWRIAIERPLAEKRELEAAVPLINGAMATAGGSRHFFEYNGKRYSHIIDPATGRPIEHTLASVTVATDKCFDADGWDTPLMVLGPERGSELAERLGIAAMFVSHGEDGAADAVKTTSAWRKRFGK